MQTNLGFRESLSTVVMVGLLALIATTAIVTTFIYSSQLNKEVRLQGQQIAAQIAENIIVDVLAGNEADAQTKLDQFVSWPNINAIVITSHEDNSTWISTGAKPKTIKALTSDESNERKLWNKWIIKHPISLNTEFDEPFEDAALVAEEIAILAIKMNDKHVAYKVRNLLFLILTAGITIAAIVTILMQMAITRLTKPLREMSDRIQEIGESSRFEQIDPNGPREYQTIAVGFNEMIKRLAERDREICEHRDFLEHEIEMRTQELRDARDQALSATELKSQFLANISHELRTPLNSIIGFTELTREELEDDGIVKYSEDLEQVVLSSHHLLELINNLLDIAKIESGKEEVNIDEIEVNSVVQEVVRSVQVLFKNNNNEAVVSVLSKPTRMTTDRKKLNQILLNLLSNASKFTKNGTVNIDVEIVGSHVNFTVTDTGPGVPLDMQQQIFHQFKQTQNKIDISIQGTGLGLAICKEYTSMLNGRIYIDSSYTAGAKFVLELPLNQRARIQADRSVEILE